MQDPVLMQLLGSRQKLVHQRLDLARRKARPRFVERREQSLEIVLHKFHHQKNLIQSLADTHFVQSNDGRMLFGQRQRLDLSQRCDREPRLVQPILGELELFHCDVV